nr:immunoglobulin light chain junction region [Macaca mulatta]
DYYCGSWDPTGYHWIF